MDWLEIRLKICALGAHLTRTWAWGWPHRIFNRWIISLAASVTPPRPYRFSLWTPTPPGGPVAQPPMPSSEYVSWPGLFDRGFTGRHLGPHAGPPRTEPNPDAIWAVLHRRADMAPAPATHALLCFFAQWFTDSFLRTDPFDQRRNTSNHEVDLCQIYGLDEASTRALRAGRDGLLRARGDAGAEWPPLLFKNEALDPAFFRDEHHDSLSYLRTEEIRSAWTARIAKNIPGVDVMTDPERRDHLYALGLDRGGSTILYSAFNTIFLREHNRIARELAAAEGWKDDDQLFETARLINLRQFLTIVVEEYIEHLTGGISGLRFDRTFAEGCRWYRTNRISIEFNLLYRWHSLVPDTIEIGGTKVSASDFRFNNALLERVGLSEALSAASRAPAGALALGNTPTFLEIPERAGLRWARDARLRSFNDYRERFGLARYRSIAKLVGRDGDPAPLVELYRGDIDAVEFTIGLLAEGRSASDVLPDTMKRLVAYDAFTHILTNPLLASDVHNVETFSRYGLSAIEARATFAEIIDRNTRTEVTRARIAF